MTETVLHASANLTTNGFFEGSFDLSDLITKFRITVNSFDAKGRIGYSRKDFQTQKPFYANFEIPTSFVVGDDLNIPVYLYNLQSSPASV